MGPPPVRIAGGGFFYAKFSYRNESATRRATQEGRIPGKASTKFAVFRAKVSLRFRQSGSGRTSAGGVFTPRETALASSVDKVVRAGHCRTSWSAFAFPAAYLLPTSFEPSPQSLNATRVAPPILP